MNIPRTLKHLLLTSVFALCAAVWSQPAAAQAPYFYTGYWGGYPFGWGYFGYTVWPAGIWTYPYAYGYDYGPIIYRIPTYGVLAWSQTQEVGGYAWGSDSVDDAASLALQNCTAQDCRPVVWVSNGCAALATSPTDKRLGWAYANDKYQAISAARQACSNSGGVGCIARGFVCSF